MATVATAQKLDPDLHLSFATLSLLLISLLSFMCQQRCKFLEEMVRNELID
jgi:hypothetical protein